MLQSDIPHILMAVKNTLRSKGLTYKDVAARMGIHQATIKRNLNGRGVSLEFLESICGIVGLRISELIEIAEGIRDDRRRKLTLRQEAGLAANLFTAFIFYLLQCKWTPEEVRKEFNLPEAQLIKHLVRMDKLGLIKLLPNNKIRMLVARHPDWKPGGPMRQTFTQWVGQQFADMDYPQSGMFEVETIKVSHASLALIRGMMEDFSEAVTKVGAQDRHIAGGQTQWYSMLVAMRAVDPSSIPDKD